LGLATNAYRHSTIESLKHLDIYDKFDAVACYDDVSRGKPEPDMLYRVLDELQVPKEHAVFIGDGSRDLLAAQKAEIDYIMVNWGFSEYHDALKSIEGLREILL